VRVPPERLPTKTPTHRRKHRTLRVILFMILLSNYSYQ
jgi:hypothetical protein